MSVPYFCVPLGTSLCTEKEYQERLKKAKEAKRRQRESDRVARGQVLDDVLPKDPKQQIPRSIHEFPELADYTNEMQQDEKEPILSSTAADPNNTKMKPRSRQGPSNGSLEDVESTSSSKRELEEAKRMVQRLQHELAQLVERQREQLDEAKAKQVMEHVTANARVNEMQAKLDQAVQQARQQRVLQSEAIAAHRREHNQQVHQLEDQLKEAQLRADQQDKASASQRAQLEDAQQRADELQQKIAESSQRYQHQLQQQVQQRRDVEQAAQRVVEKQQQVDHKLFEVCSVFLHELEERTKDVEDLMHHSDEDVNNSAGRRHAASLIKLKALLTSDQGASRRSDAELLPANLESTNREWIQTLVLLALSAAAQKEKAELVNSAPSDSSGSRGVEHTSPSGGSDPDAVHDIDRLVDIDDEAQRSRHSPSSAAQKESETSASRSANDSPASAAEPDIDPDAANDSDSLIGTDDEAQQIEPDRASSDEDQERTRRMSTLKADADEFVPAAAQVVSMANDAAGGRPAVDEYDDDVKYQDDQPASTFYGMQMDPQAQLQYMAMQDMEHQRKVAEAMALRSRMNPDEDWRMCYAFNSKNGDRCQRGLGCTWSHQYIVNKRFEGGHEQPGIEERYMNGLYIAPENAPHGFFHNKGKWRRKQSHMQHTRSHMQSTYHGLY